MIDKLENINVKFLLAYLQEAYGIQLWRNLLKTVGEIVMNNFEYCTFLIFRIQFKSTSQIRILSSEFVFKRNLQTFSAKIYVFGYNLLEPTYNRSYRGTLCGKILEHYKIDPPCNLRYVHRQYQVLPAVSRTVSNTHLNSADSK